MLEQSQLTVNVKDITLGTIETDADQVLAFIEERVKDYAIDKYQGDSDAAKKDRAELNKGDKRMQEMAKELTDRWLAPLQPTLDKLKRGRVLIKDASGAVDALVKAKEAEEDEIKRKQIAEYWGVKGFDLFPLERIFDSRWLNKTTKLKEVYSEIDSIIKTAYESIKTIESVGGEDLIPMKSCYLETLDLGAAIRKGEQLRQDRARLEKEKADRAAREHTEAITEQRVELAHEEIAAQENEPVASLAAMAGGDEVDLDPMVTKVLEFSAPRSKLFALMNFMNDNGILYKKIEVSA